MALLRGVEKGARQWEWAGAKCTKLPNVHSRPAGRTSTRPFLKVDPLSSAYPAVCPGTGSR